MQSQSPTFFILTFDKSLEKVCFNARGGYLNIKNENRQALKYKSILHNKVFLFRLCVVVTKIIIGAEFLP